MTSAYFVNVLRKYILSTVFLGSVLVWLIILLIGFSINEPSNQSETKIKIQIFSEDSFKSEAMVKEDFKILAENEYKTKKLTEDESAMERTLYKTRLKIRKELENYNFSTIPGVNQISDLIPAYRGHPVRTMIITTWRSGSNFLGEVLESVPGTFYNYEPLSYVDTVQVREPPRSITAVKYIKKMLNCDFSDMEEYFNYAKKNLFLFEWNTRLWEHCSVYHDHCLDPVFLRKFCSLYPFQLMKTVRLRLEPVEELLEEPFPHLKMILLVRDPRGVLQSRQHEAWCRPFSDCIDPKQVCADMVSDYKAAARLNQKYPDRFMAVRYEDLALEANSKVEQILNFMQIGYMPEVEAHVKQHTTTEVAGSFSTYRVANETLFKWKWNLDYDFFSQIQSECKEAMHLWGYVPAEDMNHLRSANFYPITDYHL